MTTEGLSASRIRQAKTLLGQSLEVARADGLIGTNAAQGVKPPTAHPREPKYLSAVEVGRLAESAEGFHEGAGALVWFLSLTGVRWGEAVSLKRSSLDLMRRSGRRSRKRNRGGGHLLL